MGLHPRRESGSLIYFTPGAQPGTAGTIWEVPALGGSPSRLTAALGPADVSHDGKRMAFLRFAGSGAELALAQRDGSGARTIARLLPGTFIVPKWSPDDRRIALMQRDDVIRANLRAQRKLARAGC